MKISIALIAALFFSIITANAATYGDGGGEGFTYADNGTSIFITDYPEEATGSITIPSSIDGKPVTGIGDYAFFNCTGLTSVTIPSSVTSIGRGAFSGCSSMTSVTIPASVKTIGPPDVNNDMDGCFAECANLTSVTLSPGLALVGNFMFSGCKRLTDVTIPSSVTRIGCDAFARTGLSSVTIPSSVTSIEPSAFRDCSNLASVTLSPGLTLIGDGMFSGCIRLSDVTIPSSVTSIGSDAFDSCSGLSSIAIPSSVTSLDWGVFYGCSGLTGVSIPSSVTSIGDWAFKGCTGLTSISIPSSVRKIGNEAFSGCTSLTGLTIPSSVTTIGMRAFYGCTGLANVTIPASVIRIYGDSFNECSNLVKATFLGNAPRVETGDGGEWSIFRLSLAPFTIYFMDGKAGFTVPTWQGYPSAVIFDRPEISIQQPKGSNLVDGSTKKSFGSLLVGNKSMPKSFTIKNVGTKTMTGLSVTINGLNAKDFTVTQPLKTSLAGGTSTTFKVSFKPTAKGTRNAVIHVKSNDANESPFDIKLVGLGVK